MHGTFEISAIIIGTAAGITMGRGLLFPNTYTRLQAFQMTARRGVKIMVGVVSLLVVAALIEGNLTRHTEAGDLFRGLFIAVCLIIVVGYFGWLPFYKAQKGFKKPLKEAKLPPDNFYQIDYQKIKSGGEIFGDTFHFFSKNMSTYLKTSTIAATVFCVASFFLSNESMGETFKLKTDIFSQTSVIVQFFINDNIRLLPFLNGLLLAALAFAVFNKILRGENKHIYTRKEKITSFIELLAIFEIWSLLTAQNEAMFAISILLLLPFFGLWAFMMFRFGFGFKFIRAWQHTWGLINAHLGLVIGAYLTLLLVGWLMFSLTNSSLLYFYLWIVGWNMSFLSEARLDEIVVIMMTFVSTFTLFTIFSLIFTSIGFLFYSLLEINEANSLLERIKQIGKARKIRGMARE